MTTLTIKTNDVGQKLFAFIKKMFRDTKLSIIYKWFRTGKIKINDKRVKDRDYILANNDVVMIYDASSSAEKRKWEQINYDSLKIIYEDQNILIADKDANVEVHSEFNDCLDNMVRSYLSDKGEFSSEENSFIVSHVHRLDKLTSGLVIYAKNKITLDFFLKNIANKDMISKTYFAKVEGRLPKIGDVYGYIDYNTELKKATFKKEEFRMSKPASLRIIATENDTVSIELLTGRKHQIRATMEYLKCPIVNDFRYGAKNNDHKRYIALNAREITFHNLTEPFVYLNDKSFQSNKTSF